MNNEEMAFQCYRQYLAVGRHFKSQSAYSEKTLNKAKRETFDKRKDKLQFLRIAKKFEDPKSLFLGTCVKHLSVMPWIGDVDSQPNIEYARSRQMARENLDLFFEKDIQTIIAESRTRDVSVWMTKGLDHNKAPLVPKMAIGQVITPETMIILTEICGGFKSYIDSECDGILWPIWIKTIYRYSDFITFSKAAKTEMLKTLIKT